MKIITRSKKETSTTPENGASPDAETSVAQEATKMNKQQPNVATKNAFELLGEAPAETTPLVNARKVQVPPVVLDGVPADIKALTKELREITKHEFLFKNAGRTTHILPKTREDHQSIVSALKLKNTPFHTYGFKGDKSLRYLIRGLPATFTAADVAEDLQSRIEGIDHVYQFKKNENGKKIMLPIFIITTKKEVTLGQLNKLSGILYHKVKFEKYISNSQTTQCFRCQRFDHSSKHCNLKYRCVICGEEHDAKDCTKRVKPKCVNCGETHVASYRNCEARELHVAKKTANKVHSRNIRKPSAPTNKGHPEMARILPPTRKVNAATSYAAITKGMAPIRPVPTTSTSTAKEPTTSTSIFADSTATQSTSDIRNTIFMIQEAKSIYEELQQMKIPQILGELKKMISQLKTVSTAFDKVSVLVKYAHLFDDTAP